MLWMLAKAQVRAALLAGADAEALARLMDAVDGQPLLDLPINRAMTRRDNVLVLA